MKTRDLSPCPPPPPKLPEIPPNLLYEFALCQLKDIAEKSSDQKARVEACSILLSLI